MTDIKHNEPNDRELWRMVDSGSSPAAGSCPSLVELAAYIDGRLPPGDHERIETHLGGCRVCLAAVSEIRVGSAQIPGAEVPEAVIDSAKALRPAPVYPSRWRLAEWLTVGAAAAASIAVGVVGYQAGIRSVVPESALAPELTTEISFGVMDPAGPDDSELALFGLGLEEAIR